MRIANGAKNNFFKFLRLILRLINAQNKAQDRAQECFLFMFHKTQESRGWYLSGALWAHVKKNEKIQIFDLHKAQAFCVPPLLDLFTWLYKQGASGH